MIISVHVPKTAGISMLTAWEEAFPERVLRDYANEFGAADRYETAADVAAHKEQIAERYDVVHGHFHADKYEAFPDETWVIFLRDPVRRLLSLHEQMRRRLERGRSLPSPEREAAVWAVNDDPGRVLEFASTFSPPQGVYRRFVGTRGVDGFDVVGITERYQRSLELVEAAVGRPLAVHDKNTSEPTALVRYVDETPAVRAELESALQADYDIYRQALARFEALAGVSPA